MTGTADAVVIGGGVNGASAAYHLAVRGAGRVLLLDVPSPRAATAKSGAMLTLHHPSLEQSVLAYKGLTSLHAFAELTGSDVGFVRTGIVQLLPARHAEQMRRNLAEQQAAGLPVAELPLADLAAMLADGDFSDVGAAVLEPESGYADPLRTVWAYRDAAVRAGARIEACRALRIRHRGGRVLGVETEQGTVAAPTVVLAAGAWSAGLLAGLGIDLGLSTRRVQVVGFRTRQAGRARRPVVLDQVTGAWVRPDAETSVLAGLELGLPVAGPDEGDEGVDQSYVELCRARLAGRFPALADAPMRGGWAGLIAMGPGGRPVVDRLAEAAGLYCAVGDSGGAFKTAPVVGEHLAEWIVHGGPQSTDLLPLARTRVHDTARADGYGRFGSAAGLTRELRRLRQTTKSE
ncbi:FAD-binding oxidoreductase [Kitasatospora sp. NPDC049285]|uniref:NAD(P)/FAD-dependent oxidoreductase n=1 Tax=Kitasatospora sp. NPDC049285 TaxID=3157096 RepID=UPI00343DC676